VLRDSLADLTEEVRLLARDIYPRVLEDLGLPAALRELAREAGRLASASITVEESGDASTIPLPVASALFRVAEEALANAIRHAEATHISMVLTTRVLEAAEASLLISDNGIGFDTTNVFRTGHTSGFFAMRERLGLVNGTCEVRSDVGRGTRVVAHVSLTPERILAGVA
jgi:signal transduction histidine kinase